jgi:hypothetical protein
MRTIKPPALATWLVEHARPGPPNEALTGDLTEQFSQGRSAVWFWRQALSAVLVAYAKEWRLFAWAAAMTLLAAEFYAGNYGSAPAGRAFPGPGASPHWLASLFLAAASFTLRPLPILIFSSSFYFGLGSSSAVMENWKELGLWRRGWIAMWKPFAIGYLVALFSTLLLLAVLPARTHPVLVGNIVRLAPIFLAVLVMTCVAPPNNVRKGTLQLFRIDPPVNW